MAASFKHLAFLAIPQSDLSQTACPQVAAVRCCLMLDAEVVKVQAVEVQVLAGRCGRGHGFCGCRKRISCHCFLLSLQIVNNMAKQKEGK